MNGPGHYKKAEEYLELANEEPTGTRAERYYLRAAKAHAKLAAIAQPVEMNSRYKPVIDEWFEALGLSPDYE